MDDVQLMVYMFTRLLELRDNLSSAETKQRDRVSLMAESDRVKNDRRDELDALRKQVFSLFLFRNFYIFIYGWNFVSNLIHM